jgi:hypothetical protein
VSVDAGASALIIQTHFCVGEWKSHLCQYCRSRNKWPDIYFDFPGFSAGFKPRATPATYFGIYSSHPTMGMLSHPTMGVFSLSTMGVLSLSTMESGLAN